MASSATATHAVPRLQKALDEVCSKNQQRAKMMHEAYECSHSLLSIPHLHARSFPNPTSRPTKPVTPINAWAVCTLIMHELSRRNTIALQKDRTNDNQQTQPYNISTILSDNIYTLNLGDAHHESAGLHLLAIST